MNKERPILPNLLKEQTTEIERFQNTVLRPIIKMQHKLLIESFKHYLLNKKIDFKTISDERKKITIKSIFQKDSNYKNLIIGMIVACFSLEEFSCYNRETSEFNRRITQIIAQRLQNSIT